MAVWLTQFYLLKTSKAKKGVVGHSLNLVPLQVDVCQILHTSDGSWDPPEVVLEAEELLQSNLLYKDAVRDVEEITVWQVEALKLFQSCECSCMKITDVLIVRHFQVH